LAGGLVLGLDSAFAACGDEGSSDKCGGASLEFPSASYQAENDPEKEEEALRAMLKASTRTDRILVWSAMVWTSQGERRIMATVIYKNEKISFIAKNLGARKGETLNYWTGRGKLMDRKKTRAKNAQVCLAEQQNGDLRIAISPRKGAACGEKLESGKSQILKFISKISSS